MYQIRKIFYIMSMLSFLFGGCSKPAAPESKEIPSTMPPSEIFYSQLDITEKFDDNLHLKPDDWISTIPLNKSVPSGKGLPPVDASNDEIYKAAAALSKFRESIAVSNDGVYCPVCHIANTS